MFKLDDENNLNLGVFLRSSAVFAQFGISIHEFWLLFRCVFNG